LLSGQSQRGAHHCVSGRIAPFELSTHQPWLSRSMMVLASSNSAATAAHGNSRMGTATFLTALNQ
jgi:hypothetical protein